MCRPLCFLYGSSLGRGSPRERELERHAEVVGRGGVRRGRHDGDVGLMVKVGVQGEHTREGVVGREGDLQCLVAAGGLGAQGLDVAAQGALVAPREVATQVEVVAHTALAARGGALAYAEELHVDQLVAHAEDDVVGVGLDELHRRHAEVHHAALVVLQLHGHVVVQGDVHADEGRELLVDAHGRDVEHRRGDGAAGGDVGDEAEAVHVLHVGAVGVERAHGVDALTRISLYFTANKLKSLLFGLFGSLFGIFALSALANRPLFAAVGQCKSAQKENQLNSK